MVEQGAVFLALAAQVDQLIAQRKYNGHSAKPQINKGGQQHEADNGDVQIIPAADLLVFLLQFHGGFLKQCHTMSPFLIKGEEAENRRLRPVLPQ